MSIAMTFDDGPGTVTTSHLVDLLDELSIPATFFVVGTMVKSHPNSLRRIAQAQQRHEIGNHSWSHPYFTKLRDDKMLKEIADCTKIVHDTIGKQMGPTIVRPPGGLITPAQRKLVTEAGYKLVGWNVDPSDYKQPGSQRIVERIKSNTHDGFVVLSHDIYEGTIEAMRVLLPEFKKKYTFDTVTGLGSFTTQGLTG